MLIEMSSFSSGAAYPGATGRIWHYQWAESAIYRYYYALFSCMKNVLSTSAVFRQRKDSALREPSTAINKPYFIDLYIDLDV